MAKRTPKARLSEGRARQTPAPWTVVTRPSPTNAHAAAATAAFLFIHEAAPETAQLHGASPVPSEPCLPTSRSSRCLGARQEQSQCLRRAPRTQRLTLARR